MRAAPFWFLSLVLFATSAAAAPCGTAGTAEGRFAAASDDGEIRLEDGRVLRLAGVEAGPRLVEALRAGLTPGGAVLFDPAGGAPDRWGRVPVQLWLPGENGATPDWVQQAILEGGLARLRPDGLPGPCWTALLTLERLARERRVGLWAAPDALIAATDAPALRRSFGRRAVVEGTPTGMGEGRSLLFLNFGPNRFEDFSVTISKRRAVMLRKAGLDPAALVGRKLRLRGVVGGGMTGRTLRQPRMEIDAADEIELAE